MLVVYEKNSCCYGYGTWLLKINNTTMVIEERFMLFPPEDSIGLINLDKNKIVIEIGKIIKDNGYESMIEKDIESFWLEGQPDRESYKVSWLRGVGIQQTSVLMPVHKLTLPIHCCSVQGMPEPLEPCKVDPNIFKLWTDSVLKIALLEYSVVLEPSGCASEAAYIIKHIN
jgi:hypothetical protein